MSDASPALQTAQGQGVADGPATCDAASESAWASTSTNVRPRTKARKKGVSWTEAEHKQFLSGLQQLGKGDWRGISQHYVKTRTPTQVASHAQKHFIRRTNAQSHKRRSSLFDMDTDSEGPSARNSLEEARPSSLPGPACHSERLALGSSQGLAAQPQPAFPSGPDHPSYQLVLQQMHAAAAAGYALGSQYPSAPSEQGESNCAPMGMAGAAPYAMNQQQAVCLYAAASAASMAAQQLFASEHAQHNPSMQACRGMPPFPAGNVPRHMPFGYILPPAPPQPAAPQFTSQAAEPQRDMHKPAWQPAAYEPAASAEPAADLGQHAHWHPPSPERKAFRPAMDRGASLGLADPHADSQDLDMGQAEAEPQEASPRQTLIRPKATHAQPNSALQGGFGCEPLMRSLAAISKAGSSAATSEASGKSSITPFSCMRLPSSAAFGTLPVG